MSGVPAMERGMDGAEAVPLPSQSLMPLFRILGLGAILAFAIAMSRLTTMVDAPILVRSWRTTSYLFAGFVVLPGIVAAAIEAVGPPSVGLWILQLLLGLLGTIALVHLFVSTSRMGRFAAGRMPKPAPHSVT